MNKQEALAKSVMAVLVRKNAGNGSAVVKRIWSQELWQFKKVCTLGFNNKDSFHNYALLTGRGKKSSTQSREISW